jgi:hypothetical protein
MSTLPDIYGRHFCWRQSLGSSRFRLGYPGFTTADKLRKLGFKNLTPLLEITISPWIEKTSKTRNCSAQSCVTPSFCRRLGNTRGKGPGAGTRDMILARSRNSLERLQRCCVHE